MNKSPWTADLPPICLSESGNDNEPDDIIDPGELPDAELVVVLDDNQPPAPAGIAVVVDDHVIASLTLDQVKAMAKQIDELEITAELQTELEFPYVE